MGARRAAASIYNIHHTPNLRGAVLTSSILTLHWFVIMETESTSAGADTPTLFIHVRFEVPVSEADGGNKTSSDEDDGGGDGMDDDGSNTGGSKESVAITDQYFDASNCKPAVIGLPDGVEPIKVCLCACTRAYILTSKCKIHTWVARRVIPLHVIRQIDVTLIPLINRSHNSQSRD